MKIQLEILCERCDTKVITLKVSDHIIHKEFTLVCNDCKNLIEQLKQKESFKKVKKVPIEGKEFTILQEAHGDHICEYSSGGQDCTTKATHWIIELTAYTCENHFNKWVKGWTPE
jgi:hypothetical protein